MFVSSLALVAMANSTQFQPVIEFQPERARFQGAAYERRRQQLQQQVDELADKAVVDRARLQVRARL